MILIIDDDFAVCESAVLSLEMEGFAAGSSRSFSSARALLGEASLVFLDITMPEICGIRALEEIRKDFPGLPVVMFTGVSDLNTAVDCMKKGAVDYLVKPVEPETLSATALEHLTPRKQQVSTRINLSDRVVLKKFLELFDPGYFAGKVAQESSELAVWMTKRITDRDCTLQKAAEELQTNTTYLSRIVSKEWDMSFRQVVNSLRLAGFIRLVRQEENRRTPIHAVAVRAGWHNRSTFYGAVKYMTGMSPSEILSFFEHEGREILDQETMVGYSNEI